jgi:hypothetical protein
MQLNKAYGPTLAHVQATFPGAVVAGGCLRDADNGRPIKDVDLFAPNVSTKDGFDGLKLRVAASLPEGGEIVGVMGGYETWATAECIGVFDIRSPALDYQLICLTTPPEAILPRMDFGICRISWDGNTVHRTEEYLADQAAQKFTLRRCDDSTQFERSCSRYERLVQKYKGWAFELSPLVAAAGWKNPYGQAFEHPWQFNDVPI